MTLAEARKIMDDWPNRTVENRPLMLEADKLLAKAWAKRKKARGRLYSAISYHTLSE